MHVLGATGSGKSTFLAPLILSDDLTRLRVRPGSSARGTPAREPQLAPYGRVTQQRRGNHA